MIFIPTYLYIKQHSVTGKLYFGKTICKNPEKYCGSGLIWTRHYKKHGKEHIITLWYELFNNLFDLVTFAISFSNKLDIIKSKSWLNIKLENGLDGGSYGHVSTETRLLLSKSLKGKSKSEEHKRNLSLAKIGTTHSDEHKHKISIKSSGANNGMYGKTHSDEAKRKISEGHKGKPISRERVEALRKLNIGKTISDEQKKRISETHKGIPKPKTECPYCHKLVDAGNGKRYHFDNCKLKN